MRLDRFLTAGGLYSRSEAKGLVRAGRVSVDGVCIRRPEAQVEETARVVADSEQVHYREFYYLMLNKPAGVLSATEDRRDPTALDLLPERYRRIGVFPAGRLDKDAEGFLLLTNHGALAHALMSPRHHVDKVYFARVDGPLTEEDCAAFEAGVIIDGDYKTMPAKLQILSSGVVSEAEVTVQEGRFHQVKKMFLARNRCVIYLKRLSIADVKLDFSLQTGEFRELTEQEEDLLFLRGNTKKNQ